MERKLKGRTGRKFEEKQGGSLKTVQKIRNYK
jgi:hypothetical protein